MKQILITILMYMLMHPICTAQKPSYSRSVVDTLASEYFQGRGYSFEGDNRAAEFIKNQFVKLNLQPVQNKYFQSFLLDVNTFPDEVSLIVKGEKLKPGIDYLVSPDSPPIDGTYKTVILNEKDLLNKKKLERVLKNSTGCFIVINETPKGELSKEAQKSSEEIIKALRYDPSLNHKGVALITNNKLTWHVAGYQAPRPYVIIKKNAAASDLKSLTIKVDAVFKENYQTKNVIGMIEGHMQPDSFLVALAHYDHLGTMGKDVYFPGANDNASGVAMLLSLAKHYNKHPPKYSMVFIALGAEEAGLLGARAFVEQPVIDLQHIKFLINFDLAGTGDDGIKVVNATEFEDEFKRLTELNQEYTLMESVQPRGEACISDHCLFYRAGVPSFYIYTLGGIAAYHDVYDRAETLPLTDFGDYLELMIRFFDGF